MKLILLCAPSGTGKTTVARMLCALDSQFKHVKVYTTRSVRLKEKGRKEKENVSLAELEEMQSRGELVNFNEKDGVYYGIKFDTIDTILKSNRYAILEWDLNRLEHFDSHFPVYKVIIRPSNSEFNLENIKDGRDPSGKRKKGIISELRAIENNEFDAHLKLKNNISSLTDTVARLRKYVLLNSRPT